MAFVKRKCNYCGGYSTADETHCLCCGARYEEYAVEVEKKEETPKVDDTETISQSDNSFNQTTTQTYVTYSTQYYEPRKMKNKWVAFFLCLFLGPLGVHKFYEGKKEMGILYLCTYGLLGFGWLYDCVCYLLKKENTYEVI